MKALTRISLFAVCALTGIALACIVFAQAGLEPQGDARAQDRAELSPQVPAAQLPGSTNAGRAHAHDHGNSAELTADNGPAGTTPPWTAHSAQPREFGSSTGSHAAPGRLVRDGIANAPVLQAQDVGNSAGAQSLLYTTAPNQAGDIYQAQQRLLGQTPAGQPENPASVPYNDYASAGPGAAPSQSQLNMSSPYAQDPYGADGSANPYVGALAQASTGDDEVYGPQQQSNLIVRMVRATNMMGMRQDGTVVPGEGDDKLEIYVNNRDIREVLTLLSEQSGVNILPLEGATGPVSFAMNGVTVDEALDGILRSTGLIAHREGAFVLVGTPQNFESKRQPYDVISTRIYRPDYINSADLVALLTPLLTLEVGKIQATAPAGQGIPSDAVEAGGNSLADTDALVVQDYESVLRRLDKIVLEMDRRPLQVAIEAMILSVALKDEFDLGVDFEFLRNQGTVRFGLGTPEAALPDVTFEDGGLRFAYLDTNFASFVRSLEQIGDTDVIATPRLTVLNKQRAEILIGAQLGYVNTTVTETSATQSVDFLEIGTQLRLRPFIARDGSIRLEVHPELSTGNVRIEGGFTLPDKEVTSVTTNIMVQDGSTLVIGGLMREDLVTNSRQIPYLGNLPWLGALFRSKEESTEKREIVLLVTPRIVREPDVCAEGEAVACEFHKRQAAVAERMSPLTRESASRHHFQNAQLAWARGDRAAALNQIHWSLQFSAQNRAALDLQADILANRPRGNHTIPPANPHGHLPSPIPPYGYTNEKTEYIPQPPMQREFLPPETLEPGAGSSGNSFPGPPPGGARIPAGTANRSALAPGYR